MRSIFAKSILLFSVLVFVAGCSSGNGSKLGANDRTDDGGRNGNVDQFTRPGYPGTTPFTKQGWCTEFQGQDGSPYIIRYKFDDGGVFYQQIWKLDLNGRPISEHNKGKGRWELNGAELSTFINGVGNTYSIRLNPAPESLSLNVKQDNGNELVYKPCL